MIVFVVNCGSSSIKYQLINMEGERVMAKGLIERIGMEGSTLKHTPAGKYTIDLKEEIPDHKVGIRMAIKALTSKEYGVIKDMSEIDAVGHRVVHGGERFTDSVLITSDVLRGIEACCEIAPLHNPPNLYGINACMEIMRGTPQVAVFDTAFHQTMPKVAYLYGLPYEMYVKYGVRRYGFHGTSHKYVALRAAELMQEHMNDLRIISCHLGNGASIAAIKYGKSIDTSMGYTPLEGLIMGTRSGEIDPAIIPFLMEKENMNAQQIDDYLNRRSGILGISGLSSLTSSGAGVECTVEVKHPDENIIIGFEANVVISTGEYLGVVTVPTGSIVLDKTGTYVYLYNEEKKTVTKTAITTGAMSDSAYQVTDGLKAGDKIVAAPSSTYKEDTFKVKVVDKLSTTK